ncbi:MAG TPA: calcium-binding protein [Candidatus Limnocylindrales bacterium]|nr:calcium-binding protein [Candidatus Limnocylindrales bacterium]
MTKTKRSRAQLDALVEQATVDCYNDDEQLTGLYTMIEENLAIPFSTRVLGVDVTVESVDLRGYDIVAICCRGSARQAVPILELPMPTPAPDGAEWIEAYRHWAR